MEELYKQGLFVTTLNGFTAAYSATMQGGNMECSLAQLAVGCTNMVDRRVLGDVKLLACCTADREALEEVAQLPPPRVEQLFTAQPGSTLTGACVVGDALSGTALVLLTSDGDHHCLRPSGSLPADQVHLHFWNTSTLLCPSCATCPCWL